MNRTSGSVMVVAVAAAMALYCASRIELSTDITNFMPDESTTERAAVWRQLAASDLMQTMILTVGAPTTAAAVSAAGALATALRALPEVAWLRSGVDAERLRHVYDLYFPRRYYFLSDDPENELPHLLTTAALRRQAGDLRRELAQPVSALVKRAAPADPLGGFAIIMQRFATQRPDLDVVDGQLVTRDGKYAVLFLRTHASAFASRPQRRLLRDIQRAFAEIAADSAEPLRLGLSGVNRFAVRAEDSIRRDVRLIGLCSFGGVVLLFFAFLPSLRSFLLAFLPPMAGMLVAVTLGLATFGKLDGLTVAFGMSLIGVAIDYPIHLLNHNAAAAPGTAPSAVVRRLRPPLVLGALTTMASFAGLGLTSFPGFREIAFFAIIGVGAALLLTLYLLPPLLPRAHQAPPLATAVAVRLGGVVRMLGRHRRWLLLLPGLCTVVAMFAVPSVRWVDDLSRLARIDPDLAAEDGRVRARVSGLDAGRFVIGVAPDVENAVALNDRVYGRLEQARRAGAFGGMRSLHALIWSEDLQRRNWRMVSSDTGLYDRLAAAFAEAGFRADAFEAFRASLAAPPPPPLTIADLEASPLAEMVSSYLIPLGGRTAIVTYLRDIRSPQAIQAALSGLGNVYLFEQRAFMNDIYAEFRATTMEQVFVGSVLVIIVLVIRYRRWRPVLAAFLPSVLVALALLSIFGAFGIEANLLHLVSLIIVMGMGVDYGIFMVDSAHQGPRLNATMLSLLVSCLTTVFVFGTLALSTHPALRAIGLTSGLGILLSFVFSPVTLVLVTPEGNA